MCPCLLDCDYFHLYFLYVLYMYFDICGEDSRYAYCIKSKPFVVFFYTAIKYSKLKLLSLPSSSNHYHCCYQCNISRLGLQFAPFCKVPKSSSLTSSTYPNLMIYDIFDISIFDIKYQIYSLQHLVQLTMLKLEGSQCKCQCRLQGGNLRFVCLIVDQQKGLLT